MSLAYFIYSLESVSFIFAVIFAYYSMQNARLMKGSRVRQIMAVGAVLFITARTIGVVDVFFFTGIGLHLSAFLMWIVALFTFTCGSFLVVKAIQKVYLGSLLKIAWEHPGWIYNLIGISVLVFIGIPIYVLDILHLMPGEFSWYSITDTNVRLFGFASLATAARIHCLSGVKLESDQEEVIPPGDDVLAARAYGAIINTFLPTMRPAAGLFKETMLEFFEYNPILFEDCRLNRDGTVDIEPVLRNIERIYKENRVQDICTMFSALSSKLLELYGAATSPKHAEEVLARSYIATREVYGESPILFDILRSLPEGVLQRERIALLPRKELESRVRERTRELEESRSYISNIVNSMTEILIVADPDGRIRTINKATEDLLGYNEKQLTGQSISAVFEESGFSYSKGASLDELIKKGAVRNVEKIYLRKDGKKIPVLSSDSVMRDESGGVQGIVYVAQDITERKLAEEKERRYIRDLTFLSRTAMGFVELPPGEDIYQFIGRSLKELVGDSIVAIAEFDSASDSFDVRAVLGIGERVANVIKLPGRDPIEMSIRMTDEVRPSLNSGKLVKLPIGLHELSGGEIPSDLSDRLMKILRLGDIYSMGFTTDGDLFGGAIILMREGFKLENEGIIETFINQASVALMRRQAEERTKASLAEKEVLLKEIHHRVKNNLQVISSLLNLQSDYIKNEKALQMFKESQNRVRSMALIHEKLYQSKDLARIDFAEYIRDLANYLFRMYGVGPYLVGLEINVEDVSLGIDTAIPCGLIINELVSNSLKYGFPAQALKKLDQNDSNPPKANTRDRAFAEQNESTSFLEKGLKGRISVNLRSDNSGKLILTVSDNGVGFPENLDFRKTKSLGLQLVNTLTEQLDGDIELDRSCGTAFRITFQAS